MKTLLSERRAFKPIFLLLTFITLVALADDCYTHTENGSPLPDGNESSIYGCDANNNVIPDYSSGGQLIGGPACYESSYRPNDTPINCVVDPNNYTGETCDPQTETEFAVTKIGVPTRCPQPQFANGSDPYRCVDWDDGGANGTFIL